MCCGCHGRYCKPCSWTQLGLGALCHHSVSLEAAECTLCTATACFLLLRLTVVVKRCSLYNYIVVTHVRVCEFHSYSADDRIVFGWYLCLSNMHAAYTTIEDTWKWMSNEWMASRLRTGIAPACTRTLETSYYRQDMQHKQLYMILL